MGQRMRKPASQRRRPDQRSFVHVVIKHFQLDRHVLFGGIVANVARCFEKLRKSFLTGFRAPFSGQKRDAARAERLGFVDGINQDFLCQLPIRFVQRVGVEPRAQQTRLRAIAHAHMRLLEQLYGALTGLRIFDMSDLNRVKVWILQKLRQ